MAKPALYPLRFTPILKEKIWGGGKLKMLLNKGDSTEKQMGESWELSGLPGSDSVVATGALAGKSLNELVQLYGTDLLGKKIAERYGKEFPLLIKFLDASADLSVQVHPNSAQARSRHNCEGKEEMWYVLQADAGAELISGFSRDTSANEVKQLLQQGKLKEVLNIEKVSVGDCFYLPAGRIHTIGKGVFLCEIQQPSDVTYRVYDFERTDANGNKRELHLEQALEVLDYEAKSNYRQPYQPQLDAAVPLVSCPYFSVVRVAASKKLTRQLPAGNKFTAFVAVEGEGTLAAEGNEYPFNAGDTLLLPATIAAVTVAPLPKSEQLVWLEAQA